MLVKTLIFPIFNYCNVVIGDMTVKLYRLQHVQNYCNCYHVRVIDCHACFQAELNKFCCRPCSFYDCTALV